MLDTTRYFQLTPDILVEYDYNDLVTAFDQTGNTTHILDFGPGKGEHNGQIIRNNYCYTRTFTYSDVLDTFVLPVNKSESKFIQCVNTTGSVWGYNNNFNNESFSASTGNNDRYDDILCETFRLHFTSRNYLGNNRYDGFIISMHIYDKYKNKVGILSNYVRKTDDPNINENPVLINQKLYTTYLDFVVPNVAGILYPERIQEALPGETKLREKLFPNKSKGYDIMDNTPLVMNIYGVKSTTKDINGYEVYSVEKLNSIYIPIVDKSNNISMNIDEAKDGDYFEVYPIIDNKGVSFSDYIDKIADGHPENYIVFYELILREYFTIGTTLHQDVTHKEQFIINAAKDDQDTYKINEDELEKHIYYRPVVIHSSTIVAFSIEVKVNIINTLDNTTTIKNAGLIYGRNVSDNSNLKHIAGEPKKYGKNMSKIYLGEIPAQVNVYNKKPDLDRDGVKLTNASSNVKIENHQHSVIGFIECTNVGVSIEQVPTEILSQ